MPPVWGVRANADFPILHSLTEPEKEAAPDDAPFPDSRPPARRLLAGCGRSEEHTSELQSLMRISYAVFCLKKKTKKHEIAIEVYKQTESNRITHKKV